MTLAPGSRKPWAQPAAPPSHRCSGPRGPQLRPCPSRLLLRNTLVVDTTEFSGFFFFWPSKHPPLHVTLQAPRASSRQLPAAVRPFLLRPPRTPRPVLRGSLPPPAVPSSRAPTPGPTALCFPTATAPAPASPPAGFRAILDAGRPSPPPVPSGALTGGLRGRPGARLHRPPHRSLHGPGSSPAGSCRGRGRAGGQACSAAGRRCPPKGRGPGSPRPCRLGGRRAGSGARRTRSVRGFPEIFLLLRPSPPAFHRAGEAGRAAHWRPERQGRKAPQLQKLPQSSDVKWKPISRHERPFPGSAPCQSTARRLPGTYCPTAKLLLARHFLFRYP